MKKNLFTLFTLLLVATPVFATCPISGETCAFSISPPSSLQSKYLPNKVENMKQPDAFRPQYVKPYYDEIINTETGKATNIQNKQNYNSNCQFGVCLPDTQSENN